MEIRQRDGELVWKLDKGMWTRVEIRQRDVEFVWKLDKGMWNSCGS